MKHAKRALLLVVGGISLLLGLLGAFLPVLPTTPFVLVSAGCFSATSPRLYRWLAGTRYFGEFIRNYREKTGVSRRTRMVALLWLWGALLLSACFVETLWVVVLLGVIGVIISIHILLVGR